MRNGIWVLSAIVVLTILGTLVVEYQFQSARDCAETEMLIGRRDTDPRVISSIKKDPIIVENEEKPDQIHETEAEDVKDKEKPIEEAEKRKEKEESVEQKKEGKRKEAENINAWVPKDGDPTKPHSGMSEKSRRAWEKFGKEHKCAMNEEHYFQIFWDLHPFGYPAEGTLLLIFPLPPKTSHSNANATTKEGKESERSNWIWPSNIFREW